MHLPCGHFDPWDQAECRVCFLFVNHPGYRERWGYPVEALVLARPSGERVWLRWDGTGWRGRQADVEYAVVAWEAWRYALLVNGLVERVAATAGELLG